MVILTSFAPPSDGVRHRQENTQAHVQGKLLGTGVLYVAESRVSWVSSGGEGFSLEYPAVTLHAISRDLTSFPHECIYMMVEADLGHGEQQNGSAESSGSDEDSNSTISEIRFIPEDKTTLDTIYKAMSDCQVLHPDENDSFSEDEEIYDDAEDGDNLTSEGQANLERMDAMLGAGDADAQPTQTTQPGPDEPMETAQFDDAE